MMMFDAPGSSLKNALRIFGLGLIKNVIGFQNDELDMDLVDDDDDDDDEEPLR
jgi:hypothetical protein